MVAISKLLVGAAAIGCTFALPAVENSREEQDPLEVL